MANETILRNGLIAKAASEIEGTLGVQGLQMLDGSNAVEYTFPTADGTSNQILVTNGSGTLSFAAQQDISSLLANINNESIGELSDVSITSAADTEVLQYNGSAWVNVAANTVGVTTLENLTDTTITSAGAGDFLRHDGSAWVDSAIQNSDISQAMVTQYQANLAIAQSQITFTDTFLTSTDLTGYATESYVTTAIGNVIDAAPAALDTLNELAESLNDDDDFAGTMTTALAGKADTGHNISTHGDVTITGTPADNEVLAWDGSSKWINQTAAELGISIDDLSDVSLGGDTAENKVLAFNGSGSLVPTSIGDLSTSDSLSSLTDTTTTAYATGHVLYYKDGTDKWVNDTPANAGLATTTDIQNMLTTASDIQDLNNVTNIGTSGQVLQSNGTNATFVTLDHDDIEDFDAATNALIGATDISGLANTSITELDEVSDVGDSGQILVSDGTNLVATSAALYIKDSSSPGSDAATTLITESVVGGYAAVTIEYSLSDGTNMRMGQIMAITDGTSVELTDISTAQIGSDADEPVFSATTGGANILIKVADASGYTVKTAHFVVNG